VSLRGKHSTHSVLTCTLLRYDALPRYLRASASSWYNKARYILWHMSVCVCVWSTRSVRRGRAHQMV